VAWERECGDEAVLEAVGVVVKSCIGTYLLVNGFVMITSSLSK
jgi:hypothetical protein